MKQILIDKLFLQNFKGFRNADTIDFKGKNVNLVGVNGSGKTTVFDAFTWCLFGKDSLGRSDQNKDFELKPKDKDTGEQIHNLETTVELTLIVGGHAVVLKRVYFENYKKVRGSEEKTFDGHKTDFYINGVPKNKTDYEKFINEQILSEDKFKLLTNVKHFSSLHWTERREILENLMNKTDLDVINENLDKYPSLEVLKNELIMDRTVEDVIKMYKQDQKKINEQLEIGIPSQLKALNEMEYKNLEDNYNDAANEKSLEESYKKLSNIESQLATGSNQEQVQEYEKTKFEIEKSISELEREIDNLEFSAKTEHNKLVQNEKGRLSELEHSLRSLKDSKSRLEERITNGINSTKEQEDEKQKLYVEYDKVEEEKFSEGNCSHCGQALPVDKLEEAQEHFNLHKAERLEEITKKGLKINDNIKRYQDAIKGFESELAEINTKLEDKTKEVSEKKEYVEKLEKEVPVVDENKLTELNKQIDKYKERIAVLEKTIQKSKSQGSNDVLEQASKEIKNDIQFLNTKKAEYQLKLQNNEKIKRLQEELKVLNKKFEDAQKIINLGEKFRTIRSESIDAEVNNNFELIKFQMSRGLNEGGTEPVCIATYKGTFYDSCSNGEKINIGLDIINGLQKVYGVSAPIFIDNAEGVSDWLVESNSQLIKMFVDPDVEKLEIQVEESE